MQGRYRKDIKDIYNDKYFKLVIKAYSTLYVFGRFRELDVPHWIETGPNKKEDGVIIFFSYLFHHLT